MMHTHTDTKTTLGGVIGLVASDISTLFIPTWDRLETTTSGASFAGCIQNQVADQSVTRAEG